jgi:hypothetical protein
LLEVLELRFPLEYKFRLLLNLFIEVLDLLLKFSLNFFGRVEVISLDVLNFSRELFFLALSFFEGFLIELELLFK